MRKAVNSAFQNSEALFFGLLETKVGGKSVKNELDKKYDEWIRLSLDFKMGFLKQWLAQNPPPVVNVAPREERHFKEDVKNLFGRMKRYFLNN